MGFSSASRSSLSCKISDNDALSSGFFFSMLRRSLLIITYSYREANRHYIRLHCISCNQTEVLLSWSMYPCTIFPSRSPHTHHIKKNWGGLAKRLLLAKFMLIVYNMTMYYLRYIFFYQFMYFSCPYALTGGLCHI